MRRFDLHDNLFEKHNDRISTNLSNAVKFMDRINALESKIGTEKVEIHSKAETISKDLRQHKSQTKVMT